MPLWYMEYICLSVTFDNNQQLVYFQLLAFDSLVLIQDLICLNTTYRLLQLLDCKRDQWLICNVIYLLLSWL